MTFGRIALCQMVLSHSLALFYNHMSNFVGHQKVTKCQLVQVFFIFLKRKLDSDLQEHWGACFLHDRMSLCLHSLAFVVCSPDCNI